MNSTVDEEQNSQPERHGIAGGAPDPVSGLSAHGIQSAYYSNAPLGQRPVLGCPCGFETSPSARDWEDAGAELDGHFFRAQRG